MDHALECELIDELLALKAENSPFLDEKAGTTPLARYFSQDRFAAEREAIFEKMPQAVAHIGELAKAGDFLRREIAGRSILLTRDSDGNANAFLNVCRHRGTRLVDEESGCKHRFSCPYHAWTYANTGALISAPHFECGFPNADKSELGLTRLPCKELFGLIWVVATPDLSVDMDAHFGALRADFTALAMQDMVIAQEDIWTRDCNWKILVEGGIEAYHFKTAHRQTIGPYFEDNLSSYRTFGPHIRSILPRASIATLQNETRKNWRLRDHANVLYTLFPTNQFLVQQDHIVWIASQPLSATQTRLRLVTLAPADTAGDSAHWARNHKITLTTLDEDFVIGESIQSTLESGANEKMSFGRFEGALTQFNQTVDTLIGASETRA